MRSGPLLVVIASLLAASGVRAQDAPMRLDNPDNAHERALHLPPLDMMWIPKYPKMDRPQVVYALPDTLGAFAKVDRVLSEACRRLAFIQKLDHYFSARARDRNYGVAFPTGGSLIDYRKLAKPDKVYFFENQGADCQVWIGDLKKLMPRYVGT